MAEKKKNRLISLADAKRYLGIPITSTTEDRLIDGLVIQASVMVADAVGTNCVQQTYSKETHSGHGGVFIWLDHWPLIRVDRAAIDTDDAIQVKWTTQTSGTHATACVTKSEVRLVHKIAGTTTNTNLALSDYATIDLLEDAIDAATGWGGTVTSGFGNYPPSELLVTPAKNARDTWVVLTVPETTEADYEIESEEWACLFNPYGWHGGIDYRWYGGESLRSGRNQTPYTPRASAVPYGRGRRNLFFDYVAGWSREDMPSPLRSAVQELCAMMYNMAKKDLSVKSEKIGDYSYTMADNLGATFLSSSQGKSAMSMIGTKIAKYKRDMIRSTVL